MTATSASGTLVASTPASVTVQVGSYGAWVVNRTGTGEIWCRWDGTDATVAGAGCYVVAGARNFPVGAGPRTVSMISTGTPAYSVEGMVPAS